MVKEQRGRISELSRGRQEIVGDYKVCMGYLYPKGECIIPGINTVCSPSHHIVR